MTDREPKREAAVGLAADIDHCGPECRQAVLRRYREHVNSGLARLASMLADAFRESAGTLTARLPNFVAKEKTDAQSGS